MTTALQNLRDSVLRGTALASTTRVAIAGFSRREVVYKLADTASEAQKKAWVYYLMTLGTSPATVREEWRTFVLSLTAALFPALAQKMLESRPALYDQRVISDANLAAMVESKEIRDVWASVPSADTEGHQEARHMAFEAFPVIPDMLAVTSQNMTAGSEKDLLIESMYGYMSLVLFLAGKNINDKNRGAITVKRPGAIERKYGLGPIPCLSGALRLSDAAHVGINLAFVSMHHARSEIFQEVSRFSHETGDYGVEIVATNTRLMAYSSMQHVVLIDKYLSATPDAVRIPLLASSLVAYGNSLRELEQIPVDQRPFFKLIKGDTTRAFNRKDVEALLVVAITTEMATNPTLANYNLPDNCDEIIGVYRDSIAALATV